MIPTTLLRGMVLLVGVALAGCFGGCQNSFPTARVIEPTFVAADQPATSIAAGDHQRHYFMPVESSEPATPSLAAVPTDR